MRAQDAPVKTITSLANPIVKEIRGLALAKNRKESGLFLAEGLKLVADAVEAGWTIRTLVHASAVANQPLVRRLAETAHAKGGGVIAVSAAVLEKISRRDNPQTVLGVFEQRLTAAEFHPPGRQRRLGGAGGGARSRQSRHHRAHRRRGRRQGRDSGRQHGRSVLGGSGARHHGLDLRGAAGAGDASPISRNWRGAGRGRWWARICRARPIIATPTICGPVLLVMGGEQAGLTPDAAGLCKTLTKIPMAGKADSLNLAIATAVMLFEIRRGALKLDG